jgi:hypothetical protein
MGVQDHVGNRLQVTASSPSNSFLHFKCELEGDKGRVTP